MPKALLLALFALPLLAERPKPQPYLLWVKGNNSAALFIREAVSAQKAVYQEAWCSAGGSNLAVAEHKEHADAIVSAEVDPRQDRNRYHPGPQGPHPQSVWPGYIRRDRRTAIPMGVLL